LRSDGARRSTLEAGPHTLTLLKAGLGRGVELPITQNCTLSRSRSFRAPPMFMVRLTRRLLFPSMLMLVDPISIAASSVNDADLPERLTVSVDTSVISRIWVCAPTTLMLAGRTCQLITWYP